MREIKFRAWDKKWNRWEEPSAISVDGKPLWIVSDVGGWEVQPDKNLLLMQYTGLKDKNGVEIYEGDIVKVTDFDEDVGNLEVRWAGNGYHLYKKDSKGWTRTLAYYEDKFEVEVIGNIYENKELLK